MMVMLTGEVGRGEEGAPAWMDADDGWRALHQQLVEVSRRRRVLEAEETELLVEAEDSRLYRRLGHVSMHEYMEVHLGYSRHAANERLRTARELLELPKLREAYRAGELSFTAVRELTRVATPATEEAFVAAANGKTAGEVQQLVSGRGRGDTPETPPDPRLARRRVILDLSAEEHAMWSRMRTLVADELGHHVEDGVLVRMLAGIVAESDIERPHIDADVESDGDRPRVGVDDADLERPRVDVDGAAETTAVAVPAGPASAPADIAISGGRVATVGSITALTLHAAGGTARPKSPQSKPRATPPSLLHAVSTCARCMTTVAVTAGTEAPLTDAERSRTECDALRIGDVAKEGGRVQYAVPAGTRMKVFVRDKFRCAVPGCRSRRCLEVHHIVPRSLGGTNELSNLVLLCAGHHQLHHDGKLRIEGRAPAVEISWVNSDLDDRFSHPTPIALAARHAGATDPRDGM